MNTKNILVLIVAVTFLACFVRVALQLHDLGENSLPNNSGNGVMDEQLVLTINTLNNFPILLVIIFGLAVLILWWLGQQETVKTKK